MNSVEIHESGQHPSALERLEADGHYRPAASNLVDLGPPQPMPDDAQPLSEVLAEMRDSERW